MPRARILLSIALFAGLAIAGCAAGREFVRPDPASLVLGKVTYLEILERFGRPYQEGSFIRNEQAIKALTYSYSSAMGTPLIAGVTPARTISFNFHNDRLVAHQFVSSYKEDHTDFDESKVQDIKKGETTRDQVVKLLGAPSGLYAYPLLKNKDEIGIGYLYTQVKRHGVTGLKTYLKQLIVSFDARGVVTDIQYAMSGER